MSQSSAQTIEHQIVEILEQEHQLLLKADFENLHDVTQKKEDLIAVLQAQDKRQNPKLTRAIHTKAQRNSQLYEAALTGLSQAIDRLADIRSTLGKMTTYDNRGALMTTVVDDPTVSVKA